MSYFPNISSINTNEYTLFAEEGQREVLNLWQLHVTSCHNQCATDMLRTNLILQCVT